MAVYSDFVASTPLARECAGSRQVSVLAGIVALLILLSAATFLRYSGVVGITHDTLAISAAMYLGLDANAAFGVAHLVVIVGNGFRFGHRTWPATLCSMLGFGVVHQIVLLASQCHAEFHCRPDGSAGPHVRLAEPLHKARAEN
jgi:hypothetical protein